MLVAAPVEEPQPGRQAERPTVHAVVVAAGVRPARGPAPGRDGRLRAQLQARAVGLPRRREVARAQGPLGVVLQAPQGGFDLLAAQQPAGRQGGAAQRALFGRGTEAREGHARQPALVDPQRQAARGLVPLARHARGQVALVVVAPLQHQGQPLGGLEQRPAGLDPQQARHLLGVKTVAPSTRTSPSAARAGSWAAAEGRAHVSNDSSTPSPRALKPGTSGDGL